MNGCASGCWRARGVQRSPTDGRKGGSKADLTLTRVLWTSTALADVRAIEGYVAVSNPSAARRVAVELIVAADRLATFFVPIAVVQG